MELYEVMRTTSAVRQFTNDPLPDEILYTILDTARFAPSGGNRQGARIVIIRDRGTRQALVDLTIPGAKKYVAQRQAAYPTVRSRRPMFLRVSRLRCWRRRSFLSSALICGWWLHSTRNSIALASSEALRFIRSCGTSCSRRETRVSAEPLRQWRWPKSRGCGNC